MNQLFSAWLDNLRRQGDVEILDATLARPTSPRGQEAINERRACQGYRAAAPAAHLWNTVGVAVVLAGIVAVLALWASSPQFEELVRRRLATQLQNITGGRVEIGSYHWRLLVWRRRRTTSSSTATKAQRSSLRAHRVTARARRHPGRVQPAHRTAPARHHRPQIHLIFYRDGETNQPHPGKPIASSRAGLDRLFRLHVNHLVVRNGGIDLDNRAAYLDFQNRYQPLDFRADDVSADMAHIPASAQRRRPTAWRSAFAI